ncbi:MAG: hypothetical protein VR64_05715 [Desulfatitalea sp. BRH_c12]|nr:MAG: hypothetical protein VR64_05715 [Desulfatitalea sp. BRH_c12]
MKKLLVVLLVLGLAAPAIAADFNFYGSLRTRLGYYEVDEAYIGGPAMDGTIAANGDDDYGTMLSLSGQSRFGVKAIASDSLAAVVEFGLREGSRKAVAGVAEEDNAVYLRLAYGVWNFGAGKLTVGKNYTPGTFLGYSNQGGDTGAQGEAVMLVNGLAYIGRQPLVQLTFGTFEFALIQPNTDAANYAADGYGDKDFTFPRIEAAYVFRTPVVAIRPVVGFQTYDVESAGGVADESIDSYMAGLGVSLTLGPAYVKATASYLQNPGNYGQTNVLSPTFMNAAIDATGDVEDATLLQGTFVVGMKINDLLGVEAGVGYGKSERDNVVTPLGTFDGEQEGFLYYIQLPITMAKGFKITPEIGYLDRKEAKIGPIETDLGSLTYFDIAFQIDF